MTEYDRKSDALGVRVEPLGWDEPDPRWVGRLAELEAENARLREALGAARSQAIDDTLAALVAHEMYQYRPKAFRGFIEYAETLKALSTKGEA